MKRSDLLITLAAAATVAIGAGAATGAAEPPWLEALNARSEALNQQYGLGSEVREPARTAAPAWLRALMIRSDALNRQYELGEYAPTS